MPVGLGEFFHCASLEVQPKGHDSGGKHAMAACLGDGHAPQTTPRPRLATDLNKNNNPHRNHLAQKVKILRSIIAWRQNT